MVILVLYREKDLEKKINIYIGKAYDCPRALESENIYPYQYFKERKTMSRERNEYGCTSALERESLCLEGESM